MNLMVRQMSVSSLVITHEIIFKFSRFKIIYFLMIFNPAYYLALTTQKNGPKKRIHQSLSVCTQPDFHSRKQSMTLIFHSSRASIKVKQKTTRHCDLWKTTKIFYLSEAQELEKHIQQLQQALKQQSIEKVYISSHVRN